MATKVGEQDGIKAAVNRLRDLDPAGTKLVKSDDGWPGIETLPPDVSTWKAYDKLERTLQIVVDDHDAAIAGGGGGSSPGPNPEPPPEDYLAAARARVFLANDPLHPVRAGAPRWLVPVVTADLGYREWYEPEVIAELRDYFNVQGLVEAWCDCRIASGYVPGEGTGYDVAEQMVDELELDGPAWGQCETTAEFDNAYAGGARRMVGSCNAQVLDADRLELVASAEVLLTVELYCNKDQGLQPDWRGANEGIGGNTIACYGSAEEGAVYTPVTWYRARGLYVPQYDSVYGVGLLDQDWRDLA